jgi:hypothetical protein
MTKKYHMDVEKRGRNVIVIKQNIVGENWEQWYLLSSDRHHDSRDCNRALELEHLEKAKKRSARIIDMGDLFDVMQGKYDPRRDYPEMRPEYIERMSRDRTGYLDVVVKDAIEFYRPFAPLFVMVGRGNHETAIQSHNDTDLVDRFVYGMNAAAKTQIFTGGYGGWVRFQFSMNGTQRESINLKYFHGAGGGGPVTKGVIQSNRQAVYLPDAHIVIGGHIHESWILAIPRERVSNEGIVSQDLQYHVRTPSYKNDYTDGSGGWHVERGGPPKPMGAVWLRFTRERRHVRIELMQDLG